LTIPQDGRVNALYSTPSIYTDAKFAANEPWPLKTNDFFPYVVSYVHNLHHISALVVLFLLHSYDCISLIRYADNPNAYWTGYFTSRPALKQYVRMMSGYYLVVLPPPSTWCPPDVQKTI
jgi:alpha-mannosidase